MKIIIGIAIMLAIAGVAIGLVVGFGLYQKSINDELVNKTTTPRTTMPSTSSTTTTPSPFANITICDKVGRCNVSLVNSVCYNMYRLFICHKYTQNSRLNVYTLNQH